MSPKAKPPAGRKKAGIDLARVIPAPVAATRAARQEARTFLAETDWMVLRFAETGQPVPGDIAKARATARDTLGAPR